MNPINNPNENPQPTTTTSGIKSLIIFLIILDTIGVALLTIFLSFAFNSPKSQKENLNTNSLANQVSLTPIPTHTPIATIYSKLDTSNWKSYTSEEVGFTIKYPADWSIHDLSKTKDPEWREDVVLFDSPDIKVINAIDESGIEITAFIWRDFQTQFRTNLSTYEYKKRTRLNNPTDEYILANGYPVIKNKNGNAEFDVYVPYSQSSIFTLFVRYTENSRLKEAEEIADTMLTTLKIDKP